MSKIVVNGVDGNFGGLVAKYVLDLVDKKLLTEQLVMTIEYDIENLTNPNKDSNKSLKD